MARRKKTSATTTRRSAAASAAATASTVTQINSLIKKLEKERAHHVSAIEEIDKTFAQLGMGVPGRARGRRGASSSPVMPRGMRGRTGRRVQGVKQALYDALGAKPQSPTELQEKVSSSLGSDVAIATQLNALKKEGKAKNVGRGQWVKGK